ncbi:hypothetical protein QE152_g8023 [Popillia japonica]|uniref:Uncharacterized protein n=1 Tax=Popillia japonica TaxID=7064 RepID=A0AAW1MD20_POPJA
MGPLSPVQCGVPLLELVVHGGKTIPGAGSSDRMSRKAIRGWVFGGVRICAGNPWRLRQRSWAHTPGLFGSRGRSLRVLVPGSMGPHLEWEPPELLIRRWRYR